MQEKSLTRRRLKEMRDLGSSRSPLWLSALGELDYLIELELEGEDIASEIR